MKSILIIAAVLTLASCKKDTFGYNCNCKDAATNAADTFYSIRVQASGEAAFFCQQYQDTANARGENITCNLD